MCFTMSFGCLQSQYYLKAKRETKFFFSSVPIKVLHCCFITFMLFLAIQYPRGFLKIAFHRMNKMTCDKVATGACKKKKTKNKWWKIYFSFKAFFFLLILFLLLLLKAASFKQFIFVRFTRIFQTYMSVSITGNRIAFFMIIFSFFCESLHFSNYVCTQNAL